jgi:hypothetical protein
LSITSVAGGPYADAFRADGLLSYRYRGTDPRHRDNVGLRTCLQQRKPLVYLHGIDEGIYVPAWPVFIVADDPRELTFTAAVDDALALRNLEALTAHDSVQDDSDIRRVPDAGGALQLLRHHRQLSTPGHRCPLDAADLAQMVVAAVVEEPRHLGAVPAAS